MPRNDIRQLNGPLPPLLRLHPAVSIRIVAGLVHDAALEQRIAEIWQSEKALRGDRLFDGRAFGLVSAHAAELVLVPLRYRDVVAWRADPNLKVGGLIPPPLGVSGVLMLDSGVVFGRRASHVAAHAGAWEAAPAGVLAMPDPCAQVLEELAEELGLDADAVAAPALCGVICGSGSAELVLRLRSRLSTQDVLAAWRRGGTDEYEALEIVASDQLSDFVQDGRRPVVPGLATILDLAGGRVRGAGHTLL